MALYSPSGWQANHSPMYAEVFHSSEQLSIEQIKSVTDDNWQSHRADAINFGFSNLYYWFRIDVSHLDIDDTPKWMLELKYPLLDHVSLYTTVNHQIIDDFHTGNALPFSTRPIAVPEFVFPLKALPDYDWIYIAVRSDSSVQLPINLYKENEYWQQRVPKVTLDAAFYAILACMVIYNFLIFAFTQDSIYFHYSASIASFGTVMAAMHGWTFALLWPDSPQINDLALLLAMSSTAATMAYFGLSFLRLKDIQPAINKLFLAYTAIATAFAGLSFVVPYSQMVQILATLAVVMSLSALITGAYLWHITHSRDVFLFFLAFILLILGLLTYSLQKFGFIPVTLVSEHAVEIGSIAQVILLALSMAERHNRERKARLAAQDVIINLQREANETLDQKVRERTEDLEQANLRLQQESTTDALTLLYNRRHFDQQFFTLYQDALRQQTPLALLLIDIDHFKKFNDLYGHQTGDLVLQKVAKAMSALVKRPRDEVCRYGGEEFAILLPDTDNDGAQIIAEKIRQRIELIRLNHEGQQLNVTVSVGLCAAIPQESGKQEVHYKLADMALYKAKEEGRNCVRKSGQDNGPLLVSGE